MSDRRSGCGGIVGFLAVAALIVVGMFAAGWVYLQQTDTQTQIIIDKAKVQSDTSKAVEKGKQMVDQAAEGIEDATQEPEDAVDEPVDEVGSPNDGI
jgi:hypothetical protein